MTVRVERAHRYEWWEGEKKGVVTVEASSTNPTHVGEVRSEVDGATKEGFAFFHEELPALIAALTSYQSRLSATTNANEEQDA